MRLTEKKDNGHWILKDVSWDELKPGVVLTKEIWEKLYRAIAELQDEREKHRWIPVTERFPEPGDYVLLSFPDFSVPAIGRYDEDEEGGAFFIGDETESLVSQEMFVNAWMPLPETYEEENY